MPVALGCFPSFGGFLSISAARCRVTAATYIVELMVVRGADAAHGGVGGLGGPSDWLGVALVVLPPLELPAFRSALDVLLVC